MLRIFTWLLPGHAPVASVYLHVSRPGCPARAGLIYIQPRALLALLSGPLKEPANPAS